MTSRLFGVAAAAIALASASMAHAGYQTVDLSPYVNEGFNNGGWFIDGAQFENDLPGTTFGNQGSLVPFNVANTLHSADSGTLNFWFGLSDGSGTNLAGPPGSVTIAVNPSNTRNVYVLADNVFGTYFADEFDVTFNGTGGSFTLPYIGGVDTRDYNTPNCATTGCTPLMGTPWYNDGNGIVLDARKFNLPTNFGLTSITFTQNNPGDGMILAGVTLGAPEPATWALMIGGFGIAGAALRRRARALG